jgi:hypothetical protein
MMLGFNLAQTIFAGNTNVSIPPLSINGVAINKEQVVLANQQLYSGESVLSSSNVFWQKYGFAIIVNPTDTQMLGSRYINEVKVGNTITRDKLTLYAENFDLTLLSYNNGNGRPVIVDNFYNIYEYFLSHTNSSLARDAGGYGRLRTTSIIRNISFTEGVNGVYKFIQSFYTMREVKVASEEFDIYEGSLNITNDVIIS